MNRKKFEKIVKEGIKSISKKFLEKLDNVEIVIEENPTFEQREKLKLNKDHLIFGLYEGIPQTKRGQYNQVLPDKITIFQKEIEKGANSEEEIREIVKNTIWHEIGHHFGLDEKRIKIAEKKRKIKN